MGGKSELTRLFKALLVDPPMMAFHCAWDLAHTSITASRLSTSAAHLRTAQPFSQSLRRTLKLACRSAHRVCSSGSSERV